MSYSWSEIGARARPQAMAHDQRAERQERRGARRRWPPRATAPLDRARPAAPGATTAGTAALTGAAATAGRVGNGWTRVAAAVRSWLWFQGCARAWSARDERRPGQGRAPAAGAAGGLVAARAGIARRRRGRRSLRRRGGRAASLAAAPARRGRLLAGAGGRAPARGGALALATLGAYLERGALRTGRDRFQVQGPRQEEHEHGGQRHGEGARRGVPVLQSNRRSVGSANHHPRPECQLPRRSDLGNARRSAIHRAQLGQSGGADPHAARCARAAAAGGGSFRRPGRTALVVEVIADVTGSSVLDARRAGVPPFAQQPAQIGRARLSRLFTVPELDIHRLGSLVVAQALHIAQDDRQALLGGQTVERPPESGARSRSGRCRGPGGDQRSARRGPTRRRIAERIEALDGRRWRRRNWS